MRVLLLSLGLLSLIGCVREPDPWAYPPMPDPPLGMVPQGPHARGPEWMPRTPKDIFWVPGAQPVYPTTGYRPGDPIR
jgi:hypothetical protein